MKVAPLRYAAGEYSRDAQPLHPGRRWLVELSCPIAFLSKQTIERPLRSDLPTQKNCPSRRQAEHPKPLPRGWRAGFPDHFAALRTPFPVRLGFARAPVER